MCFTKMFLFRWFWHIWVENNEILTNTLHSLLQQDMDEVPCEYANELRMLKTTMSKSPCRSLTSLTLWGCISKATVCHFLWSAPCRRSIWCTASATEPDVWIRCRRQIRYRWYIMMPAAAANWFRRNAQQRIRLLPSFLNLDMPPPTTTNTTSESSHQNSALRSFAIQRTPRLFGCLKSTTSLRQMARRRYRKAARNKHRRRMRQMVRLPKVERREAVMNRSVKIDGKTNKSWVWLYLSLVRFSG